MGQARDEAGNLWETDAQGNPVRLLRPAGGSGGGFVVPPDPALVARQGRDERREDAREGRDNAAAGRDEIRTGIAARGEGRDIDKTKFDHTIKLRGEYDAMPAVKEYRIAVPQLVTGLRTAPNAAGDNALIYAYAKVMDPASVVRESEMQMAGNASSWLEARVAQLQKELGIEGGGQLPMRTRQRLRREMLNKVQELNRSYDFQRQRYARDAQAFRIDPRRVIGEHDGRPFHAEIVKWGKGLGKNALLQDTAGGGSLGLAGGGDDRQSIPIPPAMQREYEEYVSARRGRLDPDAFASFRAGLDQKYGFAPNTPAQLEANRQWATDANEAVRKGGRLNLRIDAPDKPLTGLQGLNANLFNNRIGAALLAAPPLASGMDEAMGAVRSAALGTNYTVERERADAMRQALQNAFPGSSTAGAIGGGALGLYGIGAVLPSLAGAASTFPRMLATGAAGGGAQGALEDNASRLRGGAIGAGAGVGGGLAGRYAIAPVIEAASRSRPVQAAGNAAITALNAVRGRQLPALDLPRLTYDQRAVNKTGPDLAELRARIDEARQLGLPYALGDASPKLRALAGKVARSSLDAREMAERTLEPRSLAQADRLRTAIDRDLAPVTDLAARRAELMDAADVASNPIYAKAFRQPAPVSDELTAMLEARTGREGLREARAIASDMGRDPNELGFVWNERTGDVTLPGLQAAEAGRFPPARLGNERDELSRYTVRNVWGDPVRKVGPIDLVGWARLQGGISDAGDSMFRGGDLKSMGLTNANRKGLDFVGQESRFGPLVNNKDGMSLDDAAMRAWEAGYFPELTDRPDVSTFLDALRDTYEGGARRRFLADDMPAIERFYGKRQQRHDLQNQRFETGNTRRDVSSPAGEQPFAPLDAYGEMREVRRPTMETLDFVKRGIDARLHEKRNKLTGSLDLQRHPGLQGTEAFRKRFVSHLDTLNDTYPDARREFEKYASRAEALGLGERGTNSDLLPRDLQHLVDDFHQTHRGFEDVPPRLEEYRIGYATNMADKGDKIRFERDPWKAVYGSPGQQEKVDILFPEGAQRFGRQFDLEGDMAKTAREVLGNSATAMRQATDETFDNRLGDMATNAAIDVGTGAPGVATGLGAVRNIAQQAFRTRMSEQRAQELAPRLFDQSNPLGILEYLDEIARRNADIERRRRAAMSAGGFIGAVGAPGALNPQY